MDLKKLKSDCWKPSKNETLKNQALICLQWIVIGWMHGRRRAWISQHLTTSPNSCCSSLLCFFFGKLHKRKSPKKIEMNERIHGPATWTVEKKKKEPRRSSSENNTRTRRVWKNELIFLWWFSIEHKIINVLALRCVRTWIRKWLCWEIKLRAMIWKV